MSEQDDPGTDRWECCQCGEEHADIDAKVPGGCLSCVGLIRYIEYEAPGAGMVHNDVAQVVCFNDECSSRVDVDPATLVVEDSDAVSIESKEFDPGTGETTGYTRVEIYCSGDCRNEFYSQSADVDGLAVDTRVDRDE